MTNEQELITMLRYLKREKPILVTEDSPNIFDIRCICIATGNGIDDIFGTNLYRVDFANKTATYTRPPIEDIKYIGWDQFVKNAHKPLHCRIRTIVKDKIEMEEQRRAECALNSRIARELRSVV